MSWGLGAVATARGSRTPVPYSIFPFNTCFSPFFGKPQFTWSPHLTLPPCSGVDAAVRRFWAPRHPSPMPAGLWGSCLGDLSDGLRGQVEGCPRRRTLGLALPHTVPGGEYPPVTEEVIDPRGDFGARQSPSCCWLSGGRCSHSGMPCAVLSRVPHTAL